MLLFACYVLNRRLKSEMSAQERLNNAILLLKNKTKKMGNVLYEVSRFYIIIFSFSS